MSAARGIVLGTIGLSLLEGMVSRQQNAENVGVAVKLATGFIRRLVDPSVPLIPDRRGSNDGTKPRIIAN